VDKITYMSLQLTKIICIGTLTPPHKQNIGRKQKNEKNETQTIRPDKVPIYNSHKQRKGEKPSRKKLLPKRENTS
jgi:hypothetical protein